VRAVHPPLVLRCPGEQRWHTRSTTHSTGVAFRVLGTAPSQPCSQTPATVPCTATTSIRSKPVAIPWAARSWCARIITRPSRRWPALRWPGSLVRTSPARTGTPVPVTSANVGSTLLDPIGLDKARFVRHHEVMASRSGYMLRLDQARSRAADKPCADCGHATGDHRQMLYEFYEVDGTQVKVTRNPDYQGNVFPCSHEGCDCAIKVQL